MRPRCLVTLQKFPLFLPQRLEKIRFCPESETSSLTCFGFWPTGQWISINNDFQFSSMDNRNIFSLAFYVRISAIVVEGMRFRYDGSSRWFSDSNLTELLWEMLTRKLPKSNHATVTNSFTDFHRHRAIFRFRRWRASLLHRISIASRAWMERFSFLSNFSFDFFSIYC